MTKEKSCSQRIASSLVGRREDVRAALKDEVKTHELREGVLCIEFLTEDKKGTTEPTGTVRILLSWGGPADWFELDYNAHGLLGGRYSFQDWGDYAERILSFADAQNIHNAYLAGGEDESCYKMADAWHIKGFNFKSK